MKTNFTSLAGKGLLLIAFSFIFSASFSSNKRFDTPSVNKLTAAVVNNNVLVNWEMSSATNSNYCAVQASADGKNFTTIGFVMGPNPKSTDNTYTFKQQLAKIKPGMTYYRVLNIAADDVATASTAVKLTK